MNKQLLSILIGCSFFLPVARSQQIDSLLSRFYEQRPVEKIYVQFDNNQYSKGQTIWYKAYLMSGFEPSIISKNFYLDWYNSEGTLISSSVSPIIEGSAWGNFNLPVNYTGTSIQAIAYTTWMRNSDSAYFFKKQLGVVAAGQVTAKTKIALPETTIQFLPESGNAIIDKNCIVAFKAVNQYGLPTNIKGSIKNSKGETITEFHSIHDGMGRFHYIPKFQEQYTAEWTDEINQTHQTILPAALTSGINLIIEPGKESRVYHIQRTTDVPEAWKKISILAQMNGHTLYQATVNLTNKEIITSKLPVENFLSGILHITIFDSNKEPICQRLLLVNNNDYQLDATLKFDTLNLNRRGKNVFEVTVNDSTISNLSVSITDGSMNGKNENTIISQFLLNGDLSGNINDPAYYFSSAADSVAQHADLVMLTNGWSRFKWRPILNGAMPPINFQRDTAYLSILGKIEGISDSKIKKASLMNLMLLSKDSSKALYFLPIHADGSFSEKNIIFFDTTKIFYSLNGTKIPMTSRVLIENNFFQPNPNKIIRTAQITLDTAALGRYRWLIDETNRIELLKKQATLKEVTVYATRKSKMDFLDQKYASGMFQGSARAQFDLVNDPPRASFTVLAFLQGQIAGLNISNPYGEASVSWRGSETSFYLDEFHIQVDQLSSININDVAYIKVFSPPFMGGFGGAGGAIVVYTKKGVDRTSTSRGMSYVYLPGYAPMREFYSPNYAEQQQEFATPDLRSTIFWGARLVTDKNNQKIKISFYNNDFSHSFRVIMEGMDSEGKLVHFSKLLQ